MTIILGITILIIYVFIGLMVFLIKAWNSEFGEAVVAGVFWIIILAYHIIYFFIKPIIILAKQKG